MAIKSLMPPHIEDNDQTSNDPKSILNTPQRHHRILIWPSPKRNTWQMPKIKRHFSNTRHNSYGSFISFFIEVLPSRAPTVQKHSFFSFGKQSEFQSCGQGMVQVFPFRFRLRAKDISYHSIRKYGMLFLTCPALGSNLASYFNPRKRTSKSSLSKKGRGSATSIRFILSLVSLHSS